VQPRDAKEGQECQGGVITRKMEIFIAAHAEKERVGLEAVRALNPEIGRYPTFNLRHAAVRYATTCMHRSLTKESTVLSRP
jgi:hypothetical protein